ncbi:MAG: hypothetical protein HKL96_05945 [Phycisphaerales bacterium]|nr:hypothetical protein [Phycisphaerales bacterium]
MRFSVFGDDVGAEAIVTSPAYAVMDVHPDGAEVAQQIVIRLFFMVRLNYLVGKLADEMK